MNIAVYGSAAGKLESEISGKARRIGIEIAKRGHTLLTGGCPGLPYEAFLGAKANGGKTIAFSPGVDLDSHKNRFKFPHEGFDEFVFIPNNFPHIELDKACLKYRILPMVIESDAAVVISGRYGTLTEFSISYELSKNIGVLKDSGGVTNYVENMVDDFNKPSGSKVIYDSYPESLVSRLEEISNKP